VNRVNNTRKARFMVIEGSENGVIRGFKMGLGVEE
jgi:hypothetical protein